MSPSFLNNFWLVLKIQPFICGPIIKGLSMKFKSLRPFIIFFFFSAIFIGHSEADLLPGDINKDGVVDFSDFLILVGNFGKTGSPNEPSNNEGDYISVDLINQRGFPLSTGNKWKYQSLYFDSSSEDKDSRHIYVDWEVLPQEPIFGTEAIKVRTIQEFSGRDTSYTWFVASKDTLRGVAYQNPPPLNQGQLLKPSTLFFQSIAKEPIAWNFNLLVFPLALSKSWQALADPFTGTKDVISREIITVPAGTFETFKVRYSLDIESEDIYKTLIWYGSPGIVKIVDLSFSPSKQRYSIMVLELISYGLKEDRN